EPVSDADGYHVGSGNPRLLRLDAFIPGPHEPFRFALVGNGEGETVLGLAGVGQCQGDAANVILVGHDGFPLGPRTDKGIVPSPSSGLLDVTDRGAASS